MIGENNLFSELKKCASAKLADGVSLCAISSQRRVSRFAYQAIHQDVSQEHCRIYIKVILNSRIGVASTDTFEHFALSKCLKAAAEIAKHSPIRKDIPPLPKNNRIISKEYYDPETAHLPVGAFTNPLKNFFQICQGAGAELAGSFSSGEDELAVVNSQGSACYSLSTFASAKFVTMYRMLSGFASAASRKISALDLEKLLERSLRQSLIRKEPALLPIGTYEVILEPEAVAELVAWMGYTAFGAKSFREQTSFLAGRMDEQVMSKSINIYDDGCDPEGFAIPFDFEGAPKKKVVFIDKGIARAIAYDSYYALLHGTSSTGHGEVPDDLEGPIPTNLFMSSGTKSSDELIRACARGILIPRFHYVNGLLNPREALMTGLTREGAFLIENGKLTRPIKTLRFTQNMLEAFSHVKGISKERELIADPVQELGCAVMPTLHLGKFRFTGNSQQK